MQHSPNIFVVLWETFTLNIIIIHKTAFKKGWLAVLNVLLYKCLIHIYILIIGCCQSNSQLVIKHTIKYMNSKSFVSMLITNQRQRQSFTLDLLNTKLPIFLKKNNFSSFPSTNELRLKRSMYVSPIEINTASICGGMQRWIPRIRFVCSGAFPKQSADPLKAPQTPQNPSTNW